MFEIEDKGSIFLINSLSKKAVTPSTSMQLSNKSN